MAKNLQSKLKSTDKVSIFDINPEAMKGLETDMKAASHGATVELAPSAWAASKDAVSMGHSVNCGACVSKRPNAERKCFYTSFLYDAIIYKLFYL